jgi:hypothetical protein
MAKNVHANRTAGTVAARALPRSSSRFSIGVVRTGSRVPCSRSPITVYAATVLGRIVGTMKNSRMAWPTATS